ncbi:MAG TPA: GntR family transcriptional regulator [Woeseiaceae bacterium]|nr:GntR family transcriptional regulator [Woeseiaceae bacterium]
MNMYFTGGSSAPGERVYETIKARVIAYEFSEGERIYIERIAEQLGVSTTPVREALNRLAERNLVIKAPRKGFIAMTLSEANLLGHYWLIRILLTHEIEMLDAQARRNLPKDEPIARMLTRLQRPRQSDVGLLARYTAGVFARMGSLRENAMVVHAIDTANDHLYYIRTVECQHLDDVPGELIAFCELLLAGRCEALIAAIDSYHDRRVALLPELMKVLGR